MPNKNVHESGGSVRRVRRPGGRGLGRAYLTYALRQVAPGQPPLKSISDGGVYADIEQKKTLPVDSRLLRWLPEKAVTRKCGGERLRPQRSLPSNQTYSGLHKRPTNIKSTVFLVSPFVSLLRLPLSGVVR